MNAVVSQRVIKSRWDRKHSCIEWCSGLQSRLGREGPHTAGCARIRLTINDDLTTKHGLERAMHEIDKAQRISPGRLLFWAAIPCIGGCPWQRLNRKHPRAKARIEQHRAIWRRLWDNFVLAAEKAMLWGAVIVIEWPQQCDYWRESSVIRFMQKHRLVRTHVHGCAYGLVSMFGDTKGVPIKKPWS